MKTKVNNLLIKCAQKHLTQKFFPLFAHKAFSLKAFAHKAFVPK